MKLTWDYIEQRVENCAGCALCEHRIKTAFGEGDKNADIMLIGEGPGREEDIQGRPFVGPAGQLLDKMLAAIEIERESVYIANIVKCRPPNNRVPLEEEAGKCLPYLRAQTALVKPKIIICLGATAAKYIYDKEIRITRDRGVWIEKKGTWIMPTYHPAALLRDSAKKYEAWEDFKSLREKRMSINM